MPSRDPGPSRSTPRGSKPPQVSDTPLRVLVRGSAERLAPVVAALGARSSLPGGRLPVLDGNHLAASEKRLALLRGFRGAALPGQSVVWPRQRPGYRPGGPRGRARERAGCRRAVAGQRAAGRAVNCSEIAMRFARDRHFCTGAAAPAPERCASRRPRSRASKHLGGASSSRWTHPPMTARPRSGCGAT